MVIATANPEGKPWVSPVFYTYDEDFNFYWVSAKSAIHSENIRRNARVAITIFGPASPDPEEIGKLHGLYIDADASWRIYKAVPKEFSKRQDAIDEASGQVVSVRETLNLL